VHYVIGGIVDLDRLECARTNMQDDVSSPYSTFLERVE
jgi:hypothetical protein